MQCYLIITCYLKTLFGIPPLFKTFSQKKKKDFLNHITCSTLCLSLLKAQLTDFFSNFPQKKALKDNWIPTSILKTCGCTEGQAQVMVSVEGQAGPAEQHRHTRLPLSRPQPHTKHSTCSLLLSQQGIQDIVVVFITECSARYYTAQKKDTVETQY